LVKGADQEEDVVVDWDAEAVRRQPALMGIVSVPNADTKSNMWLANLVTKRNAPSATHK
jgi:hypothetical protein